MLSDLTADQLALAQHMSDLSERAYSAGWMQDLEFALWEALLGRRRDFGHLTFADKDLIALRALSNAAGGWIVFHETREQVWIPNSDWENRFHAWSGSSQPSVAKVVQTDLGFSVADGEDVQVTFVNGDLRLQFVDWREQPIEYRFVEALAFRWSGQSTVDTPRDDATYEVQDSTWLREEVRRDGYDAPQEFVHTVLCFNAAKVLEVISRRPPQKAQG